MHHSLRLALFRPQAALGSSDAAVGAGLRLALAGNNPLRLTTGGGDMEQTKVQRSDQGKGGKGQDHGGGRPLFKLSDSQHRRGKPMCKSNMYP